MNTTFSCRSGPSISTTRLASYSVAGDRARADVRLVVQILGDRPAARQQHGRKTQAGGGKTLHWHILTQGRPGIRRASASISVGGDSPEPRAGATPGTAQEMPLLRRALAERNREWRASPGMRLFPQATPSLSPGSMSKPPLSILLAAPRGFCAGVDRAIQIVEQALAKWGAPVYVRHEIVHNAHVVKRLEAMGAIFVEELTECPDDRPVVFSAHGVPKVVPAEAARRQMTYVDATCPLVSKVHAEAQRHARNGLHILLIGHEGHPEVVGTMGQIEPGSMTLIETVEDAETFQPADAAAPRLCHADDAERRRHQGHRRRAAPPLPAPERAAQGRHLLRDHQPPGRGEGDRGAGASLCW